MAEYETTYSANDGAHQLWVHNSRRMIRKKSRGQGLMVSDFILLCAQVEIPPHIPEDSLPSTIRTRNPEPEKGLKINKRQATEYLKCGNGTWWNGEHVIQHTLNIAISIFETTFPDCQALFFSIMLQVILHLQIMLYLLRQ